MAGPLFKLCPSQAVFDANGSKARGLYAMIFNPCVILLCVAHVHVPALFDSKPVNRRRRTSIPSRRSTIHHPRPQGVRYRALVSENRLTHLHPALTDLEGQL